MSDFQIGKAPKSILFVCLGNICRSPAAHGVFEHYLKASCINIDVDSAGTGAYHAGEMPDKRMRKTAQRRGYDLSYIRARAVRQSDFEEYDLILAMDESNLHDLQDMCPSDFKNKLKLFLRFSSTQEHISVPDPYYGGDAGFETVLDMVEDASLNLLKLIQQT